jgi:hypothetical protein
MFRGAIRDILVSLRNGADMHNCCLTQQLRVAYSQTSSWSQVFNSRSAGEAAGQDCVRSRSDLRMVNNETPKISSRPDELCCSLWLAQHSLARSQTTALYSHLCQCPVGLILCCTSSAQALHVHPAPTQKLPVRMYGEAEAVSSDWRRPDSQASAHGSARIPRPAS